MEMLNIFLINETYFYCWPLRNNKLDNDGAKGNELNI